MNEYVECEVHGGPLDGATVLIAEGPGRYEALLVCEPDGLSVDDAASHLRSLCARDHYVVDLILKRLTWSPDAQIDA